MKVDMDNDIMVGALVKKEIAKSTAALRKEVNQLRAALNASASRPGQRTGKNPPKAKKTAQPQTAPAGGRARGQPNEGNTAPPRKSPTSTPAAAQKKQATKKKLSN